MLLLPLLLVRATEQQEKKINLEDEKEQTLCGAV